MSDIMRIGLDGRIFLYPGSGIVRYSYELVENLLKVDKENEYIIYVEQGSDYKDKIKFKGNYRIREVNLHGPMWRTALFTRILDADGIDVFHSTFYKMPFVPSNKRRVRLVATFHGLHQAYIKMPFKELLYLSFNSSQSAKYADLIICVSDKLKQEIHETYNKPLSQMYTTLSGVDETFYRKYGKWELAEYRKKIAKEYGIKGKYILYNGAGLAPHKNLMTTLKAWKILKEQYNTRIPLVATRITIKAIKKKMDRLGLEEGKDIIGIWWVDKDEVAKLYACAELSIYPTLYEGLGFVILESLAVEVPCITSNTSAMPEAAGGAAILVNQPTNPIAWAGEIAILLNDKRLKAKMIKAGKKRVKDLTWDKIALKTIDAYNIVLK